MFNRLKNINKKILFNTNLKVGKYFKSKLYNLNNLNNVNDEIMNKQINILKNKENILKEKPNLLDSKCDESNNSDYLIGLIYISNFIIILCLST